MARLERNDTQLASRSGSSSATTRAPRRSYYQTSDETWQAYNTYGGNSLYICTADCPPATRSTPTRARSKVSYNRPLGHGRQRGRTRSGTTSIRWCASWSATATTSATDRRRHQQRDARRADQEPQAVHLQRPRRVLDRTAAHNVEAARDAGPNLAFFSGNEMYWRTRLENSTVSSTTTTTDRTLTSYKDTHYDARSTRCSGPARGATRASRPPRRHHARELADRPVFMVNSGTSAIEVPYAFSKLRMWRNTPRRVADHRPEVHARATETLGYEWDVDADNGYRPAGPSGCRTPPAAASRPRSTSAASSTRGHRPAQHDPLQGAERRTGVRLGHGAVVLGPGRRPARRQPRGREDGHDAAGDGEPVRGMGAAAVRR